MCELGLCIWGCENFDWALLRDPASTYQVYIDLPFTQPAGTTRWFCTSKSANTTVVLSRLKYFLKKPVLRHDLVEITFRELADVFVFRIWDSKLWINQRPSKATETSWPLPLHVDWTLLFLLLQLDHPIFFAIPLPVTSKCFATPPDVPPPSVDAVMWVLQHGLHAGTPTHHEGHPQSGWLWQTPPTTSGFSCYFSGKSVLKPWNHTFFWLYLREAADKHCLEDVFV